MAALRIGLRAADAMWARTRDPRVRSPNAHILASDRERLESLRRGQPVLGPGWQLRYRVRNFSPCVQLVGVERKRPDGAWETIQSCHTIEFQTAAAVRRGKFVREHAAPVEWHRRAATPPALRFFVRSAGQVRLEAVELSNGREVWRPQWKTRRLGRPAPAGSDTALDALEACEVLELTLALVKR